MISRRLLRIKVVKAMYAWLQIGGGDLKAARKSLRASIDATYELYFHLLELAVGVRDYARRRIELGMAKHLPTAEELRPNRRWADNPLIEALAESEELAARTKKLPGWPPELVKEMYDRLTASPSYAKYMAGAGNDRQVVRDFFAAPWLEDSELMESVLEEQSSAWSDDDRGMAVISVLKTLEAWHAGAELRLLPEFRDPDDAKFAEKLFVAAVDGYDENLRAVEAAADNWDVERIAMMDSIIATTAVAEMRATGTPERVVMDEYIEIAKYYSTPGSGQFINGILDKITVNS